MTRYLVTGGAGFIGSHIATRLVQEGHSVRIFDNLSTGSLENIAHIAEAVEFVRGDLTDAEAVLAATAGVDVVFHQAALASVPLSVKDPLATHHACVTGTLHVLDAARRQGVRRVVYAGSSSAYGDEPEMPKRESHVPSVLSPYAAAKLAGEYYCQAFADSYDLEVVRLRYFNVFGPRQDPNSPYSAVIPLFATAVLEGRDPVIFGDGSQSRDFVYVGNVVDANILASQAEGVSGRVFNVASGKTISVLELLKLICDQFDARFAPDFQPPRPGDVLHSWADISQAREYLGYEPRVDFATGLKETLTFYAERHKASASDSGPSINSKLRSAIHS